MTATMIEAVLTLLSEVDRLGDGGNETLWDAATATRKALADELGKKSPYIDFAGNTITVGVTRDDSPRASWTGPEGNKVVTA